MVLASAKVVTMILECCGSCQVFIITRAVAYDIRRTTKLQFDTVLKYLSSTPLNSMYTYRIMKTSDQEEWLEKLQMDYILTKNF